MALLIPTAPAPRKAFLPFHLLLNIVALLVSNTGVCYSLGWAWVSVTPATAWGGPGKCGACHSLGWAWVSVAPATAWGGPG